MSNGIFTSNSGQALTDIGEELRPMLKALLEWGERRTVYRAAMS